MCANCTYCAHILRIVRKLRIFCTYLEDCAQTAHILQCIPPAHILRMCPIFCLWRTFCTYAECGSQVRKMSAAQKQIAYIMYAAHVPHFCKGNHLFIADSLQLTNLTSRLGGAASFVTSISFEKLDRSLSSSCPYRSRKFSAILAASQPYFVDILFIRINLKESFSLQSAPFSSYKAF